MTVEAPSNGHHSPESLMGQLTWQQENVEHEGNVRALISDLEVQLVEEQRALARVELVVSGYREREKRLAKAIAALKGEPLGSGGKQNDLAKREKTQPNWTVSEAKIEKVLAGLREYGPCTAAHLSREIEKLSPETARRALETLRERELARIAGKTRGGGTQYALMPETSSGS